MIALPTSSVRMIALVDVSWTWIVFSYEPVVKRWLSDEYNTGADVFIILIISLRSDFVRSLSLVGWSQ